MTARRHRTWEEPVVQDITMLSATELLGLYRRRELSPVEATRAVLAQIDARNPAINAYCLVRGEEALAAARASEQRWAAGEPAGLLDGVPASVKDLLLTSGWPTLRGSRTIDVTGPWTVDAPAVARLREHGAVLLGKTTTPEFGWKAVTDSPLAGVTRNPWDLRRTAARAWARWRWAPTAPDRSGFRRASAASSGSSRPTAGFPSTRRVLSARCRTSGP